MDAFVTRSSSSGPSRSSRDPSLGSSKRLPPSSVVPSFFAANKAGPSSASTGKSKPYDRAPKATSLPQSTSLKKQVQAIAKSLKSEDNPITHSNAYSSAFHYTSCSSGHQTSNGRSRSSMNTYMASRYAKLKHQGAEAKTGIFSGVKVYINGVTTPVIGNLDLIRLIQENGGDVKYAFSKTGCTHIICTRGLSASKTHKELSYRSSTKVVKPEWVLESIKEGKKLAESMFRVIESETQNCIKSFTFDAAAVKKQEAEDERLDVVARSLYPIELDNESESDEEAAERTKPASSAPEASSREDAIVISSSQ